MRHIKPLVPAFLEAYPELTLDLSFTDRFVDIVEEGYDLVVRIATMADSSLIARLLGETRTVVVASPSYWNRHGRPEKPQDLAGHNCLVYAQSGDPRGWTFRNPARRRQERVRVAGTLTSNLGDVLTDAAVAGVGIACMPTFLCGAELASGRLEAVLVEFEMPPAGIYAVYPHRHLVSPKVRLFVDYLVAQLQPAAYWQAAT
jgi:DNA-binding transcriptional LysR family regulator